MGLGVHIRVHPQGHPRPHSHARGHLVDQAELLPGLDVEHQDVGLQGVGDLLPRLAHPGVHDPLRRHAGLEAAEQLAPRHNVQTAPQIGEELQDGEVRVGLHGKADEVEDAGEGLVEDPEVAGQRGVAVDVDRGANLGGDPGDRNLLAVEVVTAVLEVVHAAVPLLETMWKDGEIPAGRWIAKWVSQVRPGVKSKIALDGVAGVR